MCSALEMAGKFGDNPMRLARFVGPQTGPGPGGGIRCSVPRPLTVWFQVIIVACIIIVSTPFCVPLTVQPNRTNWIVVNGNDDISNWQLSSTIIGQQMSPSNQNHSLVDRNDVFFYATNVPIMGDQRTIDRYIRAETVQNNNKLAVTSRWRDQSSTATHKTVAPPMTNGSAITRNNEQRNNHNRIGMQAMPNEQHELQLIVASLQQSIANLTTNQSMTIKRNVAIESMFGCPNCLYTTHRKWPEPIPSGVSATKWPDDSDRIRLETIKHQILTKLGMTRPPNITAELPSELLFATLNRADEPTVQLNLYQADSSVSDAVRNEPTANDLIGDDDFYAHTREIITFAEKGDLLNNQRLIEFTMAETRVVDQSLTVRKAELWIKIDVRNDYRKYRRKVTLRRRKIGKKSPKKFVNRQSSSKRKAVTLWVFRVPNHSVRTVQESEMCGSLTVNVNDLGWKKLDVTATIQKWFNEVKILSHRLTPLSILLTARPVNQTKRLRLLVDCTGCGRMVTVHLFNRNHRPIQMPKRRHTSNPNRPVLVIKTEPNQVKRVRRRAIDCATAARGQCCKQRFYVNFRELGWDDWIIEPRGYYANYCRGDCNGPRTPDKYQSYHSHVIEEYRKMDRLSGLQPCCAPLKLSSMSLIYYEENQRIVKRDLPKMVVDECGCP